MAANCAAQKYFSRDPDLLSEDGVDAPYQEFQSVMLVEEAPDAEAERLFLDAPSRIDVVDSDNRTLGGFVVLIREITHDLIEVVFDAIDQQKYPLPGLGQPTRGLRGTRKSCL